jgi:ABC-type Fe3+-hydroxamate transport system substrate-binding protein
VRPIRSTLVLSLLALSLIVAACGDDPTVTPTVSGPTATTGPSTSFPVTITDDDGESVTIDAPPQRIVTFAPSMTEIVFALGLGDKLVGVSGAFDDYPPEAADIEQVGGAGDFGVDPNIEQVVGLEPDLFLTIKGGDQWKRRLRDLDVPVVTLDATNLDDLMDDIEVAGQITGAEDAATATVDHLQAQADQVESAIAGTPRVSCFYETFYPPLYTVGRTRSSTTCSNVPGATPSPRRRGSSTRSGRSRTSSTRARTSIWSPPSPTRVRRRSRSDRGSRRSQPSPPGASSRSTRAWPNGPAPGSWRGCN